MKKELTENEKLEILESTCNPYMMDLLEIHDLKSEAMESLLELIE